MSQDDDDEDNVVLVQCDSLSARSTSFHKVAAASASLKTFIPDPNQTSQSAPPAPSQSSPRTGAPSTAYVKFGKTGASSSTTASSTASPWNRSLRAVQHVVPSTTSTSTVQLRGPNMSVRSVKNAGSANSMLPAQPQHPTKARRTEVS